MANIASFDTNLATFPRAKALEPARQLTLAGAPPGTRVYIDIVSMDRETAGWLEAVGLGVGDELTVLRRGALGGPIHVRTHAGGEFAIARSLAAAIIVRRDAH